MIKTIIATGAIFSGLITLQFDGLWRDAVASRTEESPMYTCSEDAMEADERVSLKVAARELAKHYCTIIGQQGGDDTAHPRRIYVTNDMDEPEWIACTTKAILEWLGY